MIHFGLTGETAFSHGLDRGTWTIILFRRPLGHSMVAAAERLTNRRQRTKQNCGGSHLWTSHLKRSNCTFDFDAVYTADCEWKLCQFVSVRKLSESRNPHTMQFIYHYAARSLLAGMHLQVPHLSIKSLWSALKIESFGLLQDAKRAHSLVSRDWLSNSEIRPVDAFYRLICSRLFISVNLWFQSF